MGTLALAFTLACSLGMHDGIINRHWKLKPQTTTIALALARGDVDGVSLQVGRPGNAQITNNNREKSQSDPFKKRVTAVGLPLMLVRTLVGRNVEVSDVDLMMGQFRIGCFEALSILPMKLSFGGWVG